MDSFSWSAAGGVPVYPRPVSRPFRGAVRARSASSEVVGERGGDRGRLKRNQWAAPPRRQGGPWRRSSAPCISCTSCRPSRYRLLSPDHLLAGDFLTVSGGPAPCTSRTLSSASEAPLPSRIATMRTAVTDPCRAGGAASLSGRRAGRPARPHLLSGGRTGP